MPSKADWEEQLQRIYEDKATVKKVAEELNVEENLVRQRYERFLKKILEKKERKLEEIDKEVDEKERRVKSLSEGIERADRKLKETEEKMPEVTELEKTSEELEERVQKFSDFWQDTKKTIAVIAVIVAIIIALGFGTYHFIINQPNIEVQNMGVSPKRGFVGENVEVAFRVTNTGRDNGRYSYSLSFDDEIIKEEVIPLDPNESREVKISRPVKENGVTQVELNEFRTEFQGYKKPPYTGAYCSYQKMRIDEAKLLKLLLGGEDTSKENLLATMEEYNGIERVEIIGENKTHYKQILLPLGEIGDIESIENFTSPKTTPLSIPEKEWKKYELDDYERKNTEFGKIKLARYHREAFLLGEIPYEYVLYLEENTNLPVLYKERMIISEQQGTSINIVVKELGETNIEYLSDLKEG